VCAFNDKLSFRPASGYALADGHPSTIARWHDIWFFAYSAVIGDDDSFSS
jgi:hypothetical protein